MFNRKMVKYPNVVELEVGHIYAGRSELAPHEAITAPTAQYSPPGTWDNLNACLILSKRIDQNARKQKAGHIFLKEKTEAQLQEIGRNSRCFTTAAESRGWTWRGWGAINNPLLENIPDLTPITVEFNPQLSLFEP